MAYNRAGLRSLGPILLAAVSLPALAHAQTTSPSSAAAAGAVSEVIVTASKREEKLREVSSSVVAFSGKDLQAQGAQNFADYLVAAPGVQFQASTPGVSNVTMRGVGTATVYPDQGQATTGIYLNDVPLTDPGFALSIPDLNVFDVQRVEVLKGPQGTLFGAATLGGAVNYVLNPASVTDYQAEVVAGASATDHSSRAGYTLDAMVNAPLVKDVFGVRLSALTNYDPGYLDNIGIHKKDANDHTTYGFRGEATWNVTPDATLTYFGFYDHSHIGDGFYAFPTLGGPLVRSTIVPEVSTFTTAINSLKFNDDLKFATLSVVAAYVHKTQNGVADLSPYFGSPTISPTQNAYTSSPSEEIRLTSPSGQKFEWLVGVYHGHFDEIYPTPTFQEGVDIGDFTAKYHSNETSAFGEATYHFNDQWKITGGGRYYDITLKTASVSGLPGDEETVAGTQKATGFSPKASITFEPNSDFMIYALVSRGFRMGGVNLVPALPGFATPATYQSDKLTNFEVGVRTSWLDKTLLIDVTPFYVDWTNIQIRLSRPDGFAYVANAAAARIYGVENAITWRATPNFDFTANVTYLDAALSKSLNLGNGTTLADGAALPGASKWTDSETATYRFDSDYKPYISLTHRYVSGTTSAFSDDLPVGNYNSVDLRGGLTFRKIDITLAATNLTDSRGVTAAAFVGEFPTYFHVRPRTIALRFDYRY